jgi:hypothetical protein
MFSHQRGKGLVIPFLGALDEVLLGVWHEGL